MPELKCYPAIEIPLKSQWEIYFKNKIQIFIVFHKAIILSLVIHFISGTRGNLRISKHFGEVRNLVNKNITPSDSFAKHIVLKKMRNLIGTK